nr:hypothetical protein [Halomonas sp.]
MQKPRLRQDGDYWRCHMPDAQDGHISVSGNTPTAALTRCLYEYIHRLQLDGTAKERVLTEELYFVLSSIDGDLRATARDINNSNAGGNDIYDDCDFLEEHVRAVLEGVDKEE